MVVVSSCDYFAIMVGGRWFMNMFWGVNTRVKGGDRWMIFLGVCGCRIRIVTPPNAAIVQLFNCCLQI